MRSLKWILILLLPLLAFADLANEGGHGGDTLIDRILLARPLAIKVVERADEKDLTPAQRKTLLQVLGREPHFAKSVTTPDESGNPVEVSARYDDKTGEITFNLTRCREQDLSLVEVVALYLHEAGHPAGLSHTMSRLRQEFLSDIGYRLVLKELDRPDSVFRAPGLQPTPAPAVSVPAGEYCGRLDAEFRLCVLHDSQGPISFRFVDNNGGGTDAGIELERAGVTHGLPVYQTISPVLDGNQEYLDFWLQEEKADASGTVIAHLKGRPSLAKHGIGYLWTDFTPSAGLALQLAR